MLAFELSVNGQRLCIASTATNSVLSTVMTWVKHRPDRVDFNVGGLDAADSAQHTAWRTPRLAVGDEVRIRLIDTDSFDQPDEK